MRKLVRRDEAYARVRRELFTTEIGRRYFRELSIDELPGRTTPETLAALPRPRGGPRRRDPLRRPRDRLPEELPLPGRRRAARGRWRASPRWPARSASRSASTRGAASPPGTTPSPGDVTRQGLEIKTSGRYTYEMGVALVALDRPARRGALERLVRASPATSRSRAPSPTTPCGSDSRATSSATRWPTRGAHATAPSPRPSALRATLSRPSRRRPTTCSSSSTTSSTSSRPAARRRASATTGRPATRSAPASTASATRRGSSTRRASPGTSSSSRRRRGSRAPPRVAAARERLAALPDHDAFERDLVA